MEATDRVFWAVTHVITDVPWTPTAANDFRSAWIPAPPPLSLPAIVRAVRMRPRHRVPPLKDDAPRLHRETVPGAPLNTTGPMGTAGPCARGAAPPSSTSGSDA